MMQRLYAWTRWSGCFLTVFLCCGMLHAGPLLVLDASADRHMAGYPLEYLKGFENDTLQSALMAQDADWTPVGRSSVVFSYTSTPYWFRLSVDMKPRPGRWFLELDWSQLDSVDVYFVAADGTPLGTYFTGDRLPQSARPVDHPHFIYPLPEYQGAVKVYFRVRTDSLFYFTPTLWNEMETRSDGTYPLLSPAGQQFWQLMFLGIMVTMTLYNLFVFRVTTDRVYLIYVAYCTSFILYHLSLNGMGHKYLWGGWQFFDDKAYMIFAFLSYASAAFFINRFLRLRENGHRRLEMSAQAITALWLLSAVLCLIFRESVVMVVTAPLALVSLALGIFVPFYTWRQNDIFGLYFLVAWLFLAIGTAAYVLLQNGLVDANWFTLLGGQQLGAALETIIISLALSHRMKGVKESTLASQQRLLSYVQKYSSVLEEKMLSRLNQIEATRRRHLETQKQLAERDRMVSLDLLATGIYDKLAEPRAQLVSNLNVVTQRTIELVHFVTDLTSKDGDREIEEAFRELLDDMVRGMEMMSSGHYRIVSLLQQMRATRSYASGEKVLFPLRSVVADAVARVVTHYPQVTCRTNILLDTEIEGWPSGLEEALLQIVRNAFQAAAARSASNEDASVPEVSVGMVMDEGHLYVAVSDNGPGMDPSVLPRIFDPFFTTRPVGEGTGLGLTMARELIERHGGTVECLSSTESGTRMLVRFTL